MKKIVIGLAALLLIGGAVFGVTRAYFADIEISNNAASAGTFDIDDEGTWTKSYSFSDIFPGKDAEEIDFTLRNLGSVPMRVWLVIKNVNNEENGIGDAEQDWYDANEVKNDVDSAMVYALTVDGNLALEQEAGITVSQIKDYYINLVKTDKPFNPGDGDGILYPGDTIIINQSFYLPSETENWAQSDIMNFEIEILAQQIDAQEPIKQLSFIQNKYTQGDWHIINDGRVGVLKYDSMAEEFIYDFIGVSLHQNEEYCLIYAKDPWGAAKPLIGSGMSNSVGAVSLLGSEDLGDLPYVDDENYPHGAKVWLLPCDDYSGSIGWPPHDDWLFDGWPGLIKYKKDTNGSSASSETVYFSDLGASPQFGDGPDHDYSKASVSFTYDTPANDRLSGVITAAGLKPDMTYQVKFEGKPACYYPSGDDEANERIGYKGRWAVLGTSCSGAACNRTDAQYETNKAKADTDPTKECIAGYLLWDYITADNSGAVTKTIETENSYHVLWCSGGTCGQSNNSQLVIQDPYPVCAANNVNGQIERFSCNGLTLNNGSYDLKLVLTEESFHQSSYGTWATVMAADINFEIK